MTRKYFYFWFMLVIGLITSFQNAVAAAAFIAGAGVIAALS